MTRGAEPIALDGASGKGVLLLHGFGDTPQTLGYLARHLHHAGYTVRVPLYAGHGRAPEDFFSSTADQWIASARDALAEMRQRTTVVSIVGLSMGAAVAAILASGDDELKSIVLIAPYLKVPRWIRLALPLRHIWGPLVGTVVARHPRSIQNAAEREKSLAHGVVNARAMSELAKVARRGRRALKQVVAPTLVIQSRDDPRVNEKTGRMAMSRTAAREKRFLLTQSGGHVITVDFGKERVFAETLDWIDRWAGQPRETRLPEKP